MVTITFDPAPSALITKFGSKSKSFNFSIMIGTVSFPPISSSPDNAIIRLPYSISNSLKAAKKAVTPPFISPEPRPKSSPSSRVGSNGG